jgi:Ca2+:H+ antiporter
MPKIILFIKNHPLSILLLFIPLAFITEIGRFPVIWVFIFSALAVVPLAGYIGESTEVLAAYTGPKIGGLLNATLGNAAELIITLVAIRAGLLDLVKASITGSIIGNLLLVMGASILVGGLKNGLQRFDQRQSSNHAVLLVLAIIALGIPSLFSKSIGPETSPQVEALSLAVSVVMITLYGLGLYYSLRSPSSPLTTPSSFQKNHIRWTKSQAIIILAAATLGVVLMSELLVGAIEVVVSDIGLSEFFLGIILIPLVGNVAEHLVAVQVAHRNQMDLSIEIAVSSSIQIALFVAPLLVFISLIMGNPLTLVFNTFELIALGAAALVMVLVAFDGESNWLEGAALIAVFLILGFAFFLLP